MNYREIIGFPKRKAKKKVIPEHPKPSVADLRMMMKDPRYWNPKDRSQDFVNQVDEGFAKLHNRS